STVSRLDVYSGETTTYTDERAGVWITDGRGTLRFHTRAIEAGVTGWFARSTSTASWTQLRSVTADEPLVPHGLVSDATELLYSGLRDGAATLFALDLANGQTRVVLSDPNGVGAVTGIGPARRPAYAALAVGQSVFDAKAREAVERVRTAFPEHEIGVIDEDADGSRYLFFIAARNEAGAYYHYDSREA